MTDIKSNTGKDYTGRWRFDDKLLEAFVSIANNTPLLIGSTFGVIIGAGLIYALLEGSGPIEGIWWAIVTGFTVGYGDAYPKSTPGRGLGAILIISMFILALCLGSRITLRLIEDKDEFTNEEQELIKASLLRIEDKLDRLAADAAAESAAGNEHDVQQPHESS